MERYNLMERRWFKEKMMTTEGVSVNF